MILNNIFEKNKKENTLTDQLNIDYQQQSF